MSGEMKMGERICRGMDILQSSGLDVREQEIKRMQSVLYALAVKFLKKDELERVKERIGMTILGQMLWDMGIEKGIEKGWEQGKEEGLEIGLKKGLDKGMEKGIQAMILDNLDEGNTAERIIKKLTLRFSIGENEALAFYEKFAPGNAEQCFMHPMQ